MSLIDHECREMHSTEIHVCVCVCTSSSKKKPMNNLADITHPWVGCYYGNLPANIFWPAISLWTVGQWQDGRLGNLAFKEHVDSLQCVCTYIKLRKLHNSDWLWTPHLNVALAVDRSRQRHHPWFRSVFYFQVWRRYVPRHSAHLSDRGVIREKRGRGQVGSIAGTWGSWYSRIVWCANPSWLPKVAEKTAPRNISQLSRRHMRLHYNLHCNQNLTEEHRAGCPPPANAEKNRAGHERQRWSVIQWVGEISQRTLSVCLIA